MFLLNRYRLLLGSRCVRMVNACMGNTGTTQRPSPAGSASLRPVTASTTISASPAKSPTLAKPTNPVKTFAAPLHRQKMPAFIIEKGQHAKCIAGTYPGGNFERPPLDSSLVCWSKECPAYNPLDYTAPSVVKKPVWADPDYKHEDVPAAAWNSLDGNVDRRSHTGSYAVVDGLPRNPVGRTAICSRGRLGRWGPNHAADPIVTRWKRDESGVVVLSTTSGRPVLQFVAIQRADSGEWALPGGMVSPGEELSVTLKREFSEETMNSLEASEEEAEEIMGQVNDLFHRGIEVYRGYVDDPRNTDNAWMETVAVNFHDSSGEGIGRYNLHAGDDAVGVKWTDVSGSLQLYASHLDFVQQTAKLHSAHW